MNLQSLKNPFSNYKHLDFYPHQSDALQWFLGSEFPLNVLCAPTGSGKSLIAMSALNAIRLAGDGDRKVLYLCSSKPLQTQLATDFPEAKIMWGRSNFQCQKRRGADCSTCQVQLFNEHVSNPARKIPKCDNCPYEACKREVLASPFQVLNYTYFLTEANYIGMFSDYPIIVSDESDTLERHLRNFVSVDFTPGMSKKLGVSFPLRKTATAKGAIDSWKQWGEDVLLKVNSHISNINDELTDSGSDSVSEHEIKLSRELRWLKGIKGKVQIFHENCDENWVYQSYKGGHRFQPKWIPPELTKKYFFNHAERIMFMSATFPPLDIYAKLLGMEVEHFDYKELPSQFPVERRRVKLLNSGDMRKKTWDKALPGVVEAVKKILAEHPGEKGIIHTVSYRLAEAVMALNDPRLVSHAAKDKIDVLERFLKSEEPLVFVSPSSTRGIDLEGDKGRFNIICKMPFGSLGDKLIAARAMNSGQIGRDWYMSDACQEIVQATGRTNRNKDDFSIIYILDTAACESIARNRKYFQDYFLDAVEFEF